VVSFSVSLVAPATLASSEISIDGDAWRATSTDSTDTLDTEGLTEGSHTIRIRVTDTNGKTGLSETLKFVVQNNPAVVINAPVADSIVSGTLVVDFTVTLVPPATLAAAEISVDGAAWRATSDNNTDTLDTQELTEGSHSIQIRVTDSNGKIGLSEMVQFIVYNSPTVTITAPDADAEVSGTVIVEFSVSVVSPAVVASTEISVDGGAWRATSDNSTDTLDTQPLTEGSHTIQLRVTDNNGKTGYSQILKFVVGNTPTVSTIFPPADAAISGTVVVEFSAAAVAPAVLAATEISIDGSAWRATSTDSSDTLDTQPLSDGTHEVQIRVEDSNGKWAVSRPVMFSLKNAPAVVLDEEYADSMVSGTLTVEFTVIPVAPALVSTTEISIDGGPWQATSEDTAAILDTQDWNEGTHTIIIRATDNNGKTGYSAEVKIEIKNKPSVEIDIVLKDTVVRNSLIIPFSASAVDPAVISITEISVDGDAWRSTSDSLCDTLDVTRLTDGSHAVQVRVTDNNGKTAVSQILAFVVDNSAPKVSLPEVRYAEGISTGRSGTSVTVSALALDIVAGMDNDSGVVFMSNSISNAEVIALLLDDGENGDKVKGDNIFSAEIPISTSVTGPVEFAIRVRDAVGNDSTILSAIILDNTAPEVAFTLEPEPKGSDSIHGEVYVSEVVMKGLALDIGSGLDMVKITVRNESGSHVNNSPMDVKPDNSNFSRIINLVPGRNIITLLAVDRAGNPDSLQGVVTYILPKVTEIVTARGGTVESPNGSEVVIPRDALFNATEVTVRVVAPDEAPDPEDENIQLLGIPHEFGPEGTIFRKPVTVTLAYTDLDLDPDQDGNPNYTPDDLSIYFWDGTSWRLAGPTIDEEPGKISVAVNHLGLFDIGVDFSDTTASASIQGYWTSNPVKEGEGSMFSINVPRRGEVSLSIFDMAGDLIYTLIRKQTFDRGQLNYKWNGCNMSGNFAGAGLYLYVLKYESEDKTIKKLIRKPVGLLKN